MRFDIITLFPEIINAYLNESIIKRARECGLLDVQIHNLRSFAEHKKKKKGLLATVRSFGRVDDRPFGGGPGMVLKIEPIAKAIDSILRISKSKKPISKQIQNSKFKIQKTLIIILDAGGKQFDAKQARQFSKKYDHIVLIAGHYEGIDARLKRVLTTYNLQLTTLSIGPFVLTGGELPALVVLDAVSRHIPRVLGKEESLEEKRHGVGVPAYTRPEVLEYKGKKYKIPGVLKSGDHKKINEWRKKKKEA